MPIGVLSVSGSSRDSTLYGQTPVPVHQVGAAVLKLQLALLSQKTVLLSRFPALTCGVRLAVVLPAVLHLDR